MAARIETSVVGRFGRRFLGLACRSSRSSRSRVVALRQFDVISVSHSTFETGRVRAVRHHRLLERGIAGE
ncbi:hypothetical protein [Saccharomonospora viridis]|uniref:hypothetical protein n=1 Tax=Saccharomonospora viridis TaxID=1852 RepID=UPI00240A796C|nr:hypothetical protein [Saccharomonospora viridis]